MIDVIFAIALVSSRLFSPSNLFSHIANMNSPPLISQDSQTLPISLKVSLLESYETRTPPPGSGGVYPVGHTVVRLRMENLSQQPVQFTVESIKIMPTHAQKILMEQSVGIVQLDGLQIKESGFHLTNNQGFSGYQEVHAVVTFRYQGKTFVVTSSKPEISVSP